MKKQETPYLQYLRRSAQENTKRSYHFSSFGTPKDPIMHRYSYDVIFLVRSGKGTVLAPNKHITTEAPCLIFFKRECPYAEFFDSNTTFEKYTIRTRSLPRPRLQEIYQEINTTIKDSVAVLPLSDERISWLFQICEYLITLLCEKGFPHTDERVLIPFCYLLEEVLYLLKSREQSQEAFFSPHIKKAMNYINEKLTERITLQELAIHVNIGKTKLCTDFKKEVMTTIHQYILSARIELAKQYLNQGYTISETAAMSGFTDCAHFTRLFKKFNKKSPSRYQINRIVVKSE